MGWSGFPHHRGSERQRDWCLRLSSAIHATCTFGTGTGRLTQFHLVVDVTTDGSNWFWDGTYWFGNGD
jgi:hypothetical protein